MMLQLTILIIPLFQKKVKTFLSFYFISRPGAEPPGAFLQERDFIYAKKQEIGLEKSEKGWYNIS